MSIVKLSKGGHYAGSVLFFYVYITGQMAVGSVVRGGKKMSFSDVVSLVDGFVWGPVMLVLLVGTGIFLTIRTGFLPWWNR